MPDPKPDLSERAQLLQKALVRSESEGAGSNRLPDDPASGEVQTEVHLTNAELKQLQIRVIALENLLIALLAQASDPQLELAREMADLIAPRPGFTPHHLTIHAAARMKQLVERSSLFRAMPAAPGDADLPPG